MFSTVSNGIVQLSRKLPAPLIEADVWGILNVYSLLMVLLRRQYSSNADDHGVEVGEEDVSQKAVAGSLVIGSVVLLPFFLHLVLSDRKI